MKAKAIKDLNPWKISNSFAGFDISRGIQLLLMGYGVYCLIGFVKKSIFSRSSPVRHNNNEQS